MTKDEHNSLITQILDNLSEQGRVSELLTQISEDYLSTLTILETTQLENETLKNEIESLKEANMKLFLKVTTNPDEDDEEEDSEEESSFDDLFDENGDLK